MPYGSYALEDLWCIGVQTIRQVAKSPVRDYAREGLREKGQLQVLTQLPKYGAVGSERR